MQRKLIVLLFSFALINGIGLCQDQFNLADFFEEGQEYSYLAGTRGFSGGTVKFYQKNGVVNFTVPIRLLGAGTFSRTNIDEVLKVSLPEEKPDPSLFVKNLDSFIESPQLVKMINDMVRSIENTYNNEFFKLNIIVDFGKDSDYLSAYQLKEKNYRMYLMNLRNAVHNNHLKKNTGFIPISVVALPEATRASPSEWDIYSKPRLFAHELFHVIGTMFEGYECDVYPPYGIMNDGYMFMTMDQKKIKGKYPRLTKADFLALLSNGFGSLKKIDPTPNNSDMIDALILQYSSESYCVANDTGKLRSYISMSPEDKQHAINVQINNWLDKVTTYPEFLQ